MMSGRFVTTSCFVLALSLAGCSAASDFDYSFHASETKDAGRDGATPFDANVTDSGGVDVRDAVISQTDTGQPVIADAQVDAQTTPDGGACLPPSCCELTETTERSCMGGRDEDCDGKVDCADADCRQSPVCCPNPSVESGEVACHDGIDNDCDGTLDCAENACAGLYVCTCGPTTPENATLPASCLDGIDNDCDHLTDCEEKTDCAFSSNCCTKSPLTATSESGAQCTDGLNNDCDSAGADCADPDCGLDANCCRPVLGGESTDKLCQNNRDDDCDGTIDCADTQCSGTYDCCVAYLRKNRVELTTSEAGLCGDAYDNDCDGALNCRDADCGGVKTCGGIIIISPNPPVATE